MSALNDNGLYPSQQIAASCSGALVTSLLMTPFDVVKVRMQAQARPFTTGSCFLYSNGLMDILCPCVNGRHVTFCPWYARPFPTNGASAGGSMGRSGSGMPGGTLRAMIKIARVEGVSSLWSGLSPTLAMAVPATVMYFTSYDNLKLALKKRYGNQGWEPAVAGASARFAVTTLVSPIEMVRTKLQSERLRYSQLIEAVRLSTAHEGVGVLWRGWLPTVLRDVPFSAIYWIGYERIKRFFMLDLHLQEPTFVVCFTAGALSGSIAAVATLPFDVVKTQRQIEIGEALVAKSTPSDKVVATPALAEAGDVRTKPVTLNSGSNASKSTIGIMSELYARNGLRALYSGLAPRLLKVAPACAIMIGSYEAGKNFFRAKNIEHATMDSR